MGFCPVVNVDPNFNFSEPLKDFSSDLSDWKVQNRATGIREIVFVNHKNEL